MNQEIDTAANENAFKCVEYTSRVNQLFTEALANKLITSKEAEPYIVRNVTEIKPMEIG